MQDNCPLCQIRPVKEKLKLYDTRVCKKCYYGFANRRQFAYIIDMIILQILSTGLGFVAGIVLASVMGQMTPQQGRVSTVFFFALGTLTGVIYGIKDGFGGKSIGKLICGVTVVKEDTYKGSGFRASFFRNILLNIPFFPFVVLVMMNKGHRPGDGFAGTRVIWDKYRDSHVFNPFLPDASIMTEGFGIPDSERMRMPLYGNNPYHPPAS